MWLHVSWYILFCSLIWTIVESGIKHHNPNPPCSLRSDLKLDIDLKLDMWQKMKKELSNDGRHCRVRVMVFNTSFNNISAISWQSVLLLEEIKVTRENRWHIANHWQTLSHNVASSTPRNEQIPSHNFRSDRHWLHRRL